MGGKYGCDDVIETVQYTLHSDTRLRVPREAKLQFHSFLSQGRFRITNGLADC